MHEAFFGLLVAGQIEWQELERDKTLELGVLGFVHDAHATAAQLGEDLIVGDSLAEQKTSAKNQKRF